jgi:hypothetical protein
MQRWLPWMSISASEEGREYVHQQGGHKAIHEFHAEAICSLTIVESRKKNLQLFLVILYVRGSCVFHSYKPLIK